MSFSIGPNFGFGSIPVSSYSSVDPATLSLLQQLAQSNFQPSQAYSSTGFNPYSMRLPNLRATEG